jgi:hypothetical protein
MSKIISTDNQVDKVVDKQTDNPGIEFTPVTQKSRVFSIPYTGPVYEPIPPIGLPNIVVATTEVIQVSNYPLLDGIYTKQSDPSLGTFFLRDDIGAYVWLNFSLNLIWTFQFIVNGEAVEEIEAISDPITTNPPLLPAEGWRTINNAPIPLQITAIG